MVPGHVFKSIGGYRLIYEVYEQEIVVVAIDFGPRGDVYK